MTIRSNKAKKEVERWRLVGESVIKFAINFELFLKSNLDEEVEEINKRRTNLENKERLSKAFEHS